MVYDGQEVILITKELAAKAFAKWDDDMVDPVLAAEHFFELVEEVAKNG